MAADQVLRAKMHRLEELRKYQAYYGPNTPYPVVVEINDLELEVRQLLAARQAHQSQAVKKKKKSAATPKKSAAPIWQFWQMSRATFDVVVAIAFVGFLFLLGTIIFAAYVNTRPGSANLAGLSASLNSAPPTLRPTFTPTAEGGQAAEQMVAEAALVTDEVVLPPAEREPTPVPTFVPSLTPTATAPATNTPIPTDTPAPTAPPPTPAPVVAAAAPAPAAAVAPVPPAPAYPFVLSEQGNREFQRTTYHVITVYIAVVSEGNIPLGGYKVIADNSSGGHIESSLSDWNWSVTNCLDCGYIKQGNLKLELGTFDDLVWNLYLADPSGTPLSAPTTLTYSTNPDQWVWDFLVFRRISG